jgi:hypothetical protein
VQRRRLGPSLVQSTEVKIIAISCVEYREEDHYHQLYTVHSTEDKIIAIGCSEYREGHYHKMYRVQMSGSSPPAVHHHQSINDWIITISCTEYR